MKIILTESQVKKLKEKTDFEVFSEKRLAGAEKIVKNAKEKGGPAMLTYHHFNVKLPYYKKAKEGKLDMEKTKKEYKKLVNELNDTADNINITQIEFQKLVGLIEVFGELIIKHK
jgi:3-dehydroquinate dehydratase